MVGFFNDSKGQKSMTRLLVFLACVTACLIALLQECFYLYLASNATADNPVQFDRDEIIIGLLLGYAGAKKVMQKRIEKQSDENK